MNALSALGSEMTLRTPKDSTDAIFKEVAARRGMSVAEMMNRRRLREYAWARFEVMWILHVEMSWSLPRIGRLFEMDHTSALHGVRRHQQFLDEAKGAG